MLRSAKAYLRGLLPTRQAWDRIVMDRETTQWVRGLSPERLDALELSGTDWEGRARFRSYRSVQYPEFDICAGVLPETFDLIIAEQVFEHLLWPYRAVRNVHAMLRPGGHFLVTAPFLVRVHEFPHDCSRWTQTGLRHLLAEGGFPIDDIRTASWGNRDCIAANFRHWQRYRPSRHSLANEPKFPVVVWALARK